MCLSVLMAVLLSWYQYHFSDLFSESWSDSSRFLLHSLFLALKCGHLCVCVCATPGCFLKALLVHVSLVLSQPYLSVWPLILNWTLTFSPRLKLGQVCWLTTTTVPMYKMKLFILDANTCTEFIEFYCCLLVAMSGTWAVFVILLWWFTFFCPFKNQFLLAFVKGSCTTTVWWGEMITLTKIQRQVILMLF